MDPRGLLKVTVDPAGGEAIMPRKFHTTGYKILQAAAATRLAAHVLGHPCDSVMSWSANGGSNTSRAWTTRALGARGVHLEVQDEQQRGVGLQQLLNRICVLGCTSLAHQ